MDLYIFFVILCVGVATGQTVTDSNVLYDEISGNMVHVFAIPRTYDTSDPPRVLITTSSLIPVNTTITIPGLAFEVETTITRYNHANITLPVAVRIKDAGCHNKTIIVRSSGDVNIHAFDNEFLGGDGFSVLASTQLGTEYWIISYLPYQTSYPAFFTMTAFDNNAYVQIVTNAGQTHSVSLQQLQSYRFEGADMEDLTGTYIKSDRRISVVSGLYTKVPNDVCCGNGLLVNVPHFETWGRSFVLVSIYSFGYIYRIVSGNQTAILNISDMNNTRTEELQSGDFYEGDVSTEIMISIRSDKPIMVFKFLKGYWEYGRGDPAMIAVSPLDRLEWLYDRVTFPVFETTSSGEKEYSINVIINCSLVNSLIFDDVISMSDWNKLSIEDEPMCCVQGEVTTGVHSIVSMNPMATFTVSVYMMCTQVYTCSYAYQARSPTFTEAAMNFDMESVTILECRGVVHLPIIHRGSGDGTVYLHTVNNSAYNDVDFDSASPDLNQAISLSSSGEAHIDLIVDDKDEPDEQFSVEMSGLNVGDGITQVDITIIDNEAAREEVFDAVFRELLKLTDAFQPDLAMTQEEQGIYIETLGNELINALTGTASPMYVSEDLQMAKCAIEDNFKITDSIAELISALSQHQPNGEVFIVRTQEYASASVIVPSNYQNITINLGTDHEQHNGPSVSIQPGGIPELLPGQRKLTVVFSERTNSTDTGYDDNNVTLLQPDKNKYDRSGFIQHTSVISDILNIQFTVNHSLVSIPVQFELPINKTTQFDILQKGITVEEMTFCAFWHSEKQAYSTRGCYKIEEDGNSVSCQSNHTTSFAILFQVTAYPIVSKLDQQLQDTLTKVLGSISIVALSLTIAVFLAIPSLRTTERTQIHTNLAISILLAQTLFLVGINQTANKIVCTMVAIMLHYLFMCVFAWMLVEGVNLYYKIIKVYGAEQGRLKQYLCIGWVLPIPVVAITAGIRFDSYTLDNSCWLNTADGVIWGFVGPAALVIVLNTIILAMIGRILYRSANAIYADDDTAGLRTSVKGTMVLTPLLGTTWIFGLLSVNGAATVFQYLFIIFNSLQGFFIFILYCLLNKEVRDLVKRGIERYNLSRIGRTDVIELQLETPADNPAEDTRSTALSHGVSTCNDDGTAAGTSAVVSNECQEGMPKKQRHDKFQPPGVPDI